MGIESAPQSLWESIGLGGLSVKCTPCQVAFLTSNILIKSLKYLILNGHGCGA